MGAGDGAVLGVHEVLINGEVESSFNLVAVPDGYHEDDMALWAADAKKFFDVFQSTPPFDDPLVRSKLNLFRVDVRSDERGADKPAACFGTAASTADTFFDAAYCHTGQRRLLVVDDAHVESVLDAQVPGWTQAIVIVNDSEHGGSGGPIPVTAKGPNWELTGVHEIGHSAFTLADEYEYSSGCGIDTDRDRYTGVEPGELNVTIDSDRNTIEWANFVDAATAMPTMANPNCAQCDGRPSPVAAGTVGAFEGARYFHCGLYRPEANCTMRTSTPPFCRVCSDVIRRTLLPFRGTGRLVEVAAPAVNFLFDATGVLQLLEDGATPIHTLGTPGQPGFLQASASRRAPAGTPAAGLFLYEYRVSLVGASGPKPTAVTSVEVGFGPITPLNYDGTGLADVCVVTEGGLGDIMPTLVVEHDGLTIEFDTPISAGTTSFFIGLASPYPPRDRTCVVSDDSDDREVVTTRAPAFPPLP